MITSPLHWMGSKATMIARYHLHEFLPKREICERRPYVELFSGSAAMFFAVQPRHAYLNDVNGELINFWRVVQHHSAELEAELEYRWHSPRGNDDLQNRTDEIGRAAWFYCKNYNLYNKPRTFAKVWSEWAEILNSTIISIEQRDAVEFLKQMNKWTTYKPVIFADPPYFGSEDVYKLTFDHTALAIVARASQNCHILMTYNDCPEIRRLYDGWAMKSFPMAQQCTRSANELLISNRPLRRYCRDDINLWL